MKVSETIVKCSISKLHYTLYTKKTKCYPLFKERRRKMKRNKTIRIVATLALALFALSLLSTNVQFANAYTFTRSSNVAMVPYATSQNSGYLYTGTVWPDSGDAPGFTFTNVNPNAIANGPVANPLASYDTVVIMANWFEDSPYNWVTLWADPNFSGNITNFVNSGGKLIIYTSELADPNLFNGFLIPFTVDTPGQLGSSGGTLVNVADNTLSSNVTPGDAYPNGLGSYINLDLVASGTDAVGDLNVMTSVDSRWYIDMTGINTRGAGGPAHTYAFYGSGLIIFNGLDIDYGGAPGDLLSTPTGSRELQRIWWRELCGQDLGAGQSVSGLTLTPPTATNAVGTTHTVTATVKDSINNPVSGVVVNFTIISGPNEDLVGVNTTDTNGEATFSWSSAAEGTDTVQAAINGAAAAVITTTATKTWYITPNNVIPEVPLGTLAAFAVMFVGLASFAAKGKIRKSPKLQK
jgi:hypothetical protein